MKLDSSKTIKPVPQTNWKADFPDQMVVFEEKRKLEKREKKPSEQRRESTTNLSQIAFLIGRNWNSTLGHFAGRRVLSSLRHPNPQSLIRKEISMSKLNVLLLTCFCHSDSAPLGLISTRETGNALKKYK